MAPSGMSEDDVGSRRARCAQPDEVLSRPCRALRGAGALDHRTYVGLTTSTRRRWRRARFAVGVAAHGHWPNATRHDLIFRHRVEPTMLGDPMHLRAATRSRMARGRVCGRPICTRHEALDGRRADDQSGLRRCDGARMRLWKGGATEARGGDGFHHEDRARSAGHLEMQQ